MRTLDGKIRDVAVGGGGRYLLLTLAEAGKLAVFDVTKAEVVKTISLASPNALVAAGAKKFVVVLPDQKKIERWDLATLEREGDSRPSPFDGPIKAASGWGAIRMARRWCSGSVNRAHSASSPSFAPASSTSTRWRS